MGTTPARGTNKSRSRIQRANTKRAPQSTYTPVVSTLLSKKIPNNSKTFNASATAGEKHESLRNNLRLSQGRSKSHTSEDQTQHNFLMANHTSSSVAQVASFFTELPQNVLAQRGRIMTEPGMPFFITSCDGSAARILGLQGVSELVGRRVQGIANRSCDISRLESASRTCLSHRRVFLSIATDDGRCISMVVQLSRCTDDHLQIEILLFPAPECHPLLLKDNVIDLTSPRYVPVTQGDTYVGSGIRELELSVSSEENEVHDDLAIAGSFIEASWCVQT